jgi:hypothetical protein
VEVRPAAEAGGSSQEIAGQEGAQEGYEKGVLVPQRGEQEKPKTGRHRFQIAGQDQEARTEILRVGLEVIFLINVPASCKMARPVE